MVLIAERTVLVMVQAMIEIASDRSNITSAVNM